MFPRTPGAAKGLPLLGEVNKITREREESAHRITNRIGRKYMSYGRLDSFVIKYGGHAHRILIEVIHRAGGFQMGLEIHEALICGGQAEISSCEIAVITSDSAVNVLNNETLVRGYLGE